MKDFDGNRSADEGRSQALETLLSLNFEVERRFADSIAGQFIGESFGLRYARVLVVSRPYPCSFEQDLPL